jgi:hypothetical protein
MKRGDSGPTARWDGVVEKARCHWGLAVQRLHIDRDAGGGIVCGLMLCRHETSVCTFLKLRPDA